MDITKLKDQANDRLRHGRIGITIELRGKSQMIYLRGTLPPKPGSNRTRPYQQKIALNAPGRHDTIKEAERIAKKIGIDLMSDAFDWSNWTDAATLETASCSDWIAEFERDYWRRNAKDEGRLTTWRTNYHRCFRRLPGDLPLTLQVLLDTIDGTEPDSATRLKMCQVFSRLAKFAGLPAEPIKALEGNYSPNAVDPRNLPSDEEIAAAINRIRTKYPGWGWLLGMQATYGLRNYEAFKADLSNFPEIQFAANITKDRRPRIVYPLFPEWADLWKLDNKILPPKMNIDTTNNERLGKKVSRFFDEYKTTLELPFNAYDLRHAWAGRNLRFGIDDTVAARGMGHSIEKHRKIYKRWIDERLYKEHVQKRLNQSDRPLAPGLNEQS